MLYAHTSVRIVFAMLDIKPLKRAVGFQLCRRYFYILTHHILALCVQQYCTPITAFCMDLLLMFQHYNINTYHSSCTFGGISKVGKNFVEREERSRAISSVVSEIHRNALFKLFKTSPPARWCLSSKSMLVQFPRMKKNGRAVLLPSCAWPCGL